MDKNFEKFKSWIDSRTKVWNQNGVSIKSVVESSHAHQIHVNIEAQNSFGHIGLYESNDIYWVEFEAVRVDEKNFYKYIEFVTLPSFEEVEKDYLSYILST